MYKNYKVKVMIFAGRKETMEILMPQLKSDYIDEILIGVNTNKKSDVEYLHTLKDKFNKITCVELSPYIPCCSQKSFKFLYSQMEDEDTIYFKLDDDLIYIEPGYFEKTLEFRTTHPEYICVYPMTINNPLCNYLLLSASNADLCKKYGADKIMYDTWANPHIAEKYLSLFADSKDDKRWYVKDFVFGKEMNFKTMPSVIRPSINAICMFGSDIKNFNLKSVCADDEEFLTNHVFSCGRKNIVYGDTLVVHYAFYTQRAYLNTTNILSTYKELVQK